MSSERPRATKGEVRTYIRNVLAAAGEFGMTRRRLWREVLSLADPDDVPGEMLQDGIEFGMAENWVRREYDQVNEEFRYYITERGEKADAGR